MERQGLIRLDSSGPIQSAPRNTKPFFQNRKFIRNKEFKDARNNCHLLCFFQFIYARLRQARMCPSAQRGGNAHQ